MNFPVGIVDEKFLIELSENLRKDGSTEVHTSDSNGNIQTYKAQALVLMAKGCKGKMMYLPLED